MTLMARAAQWLREPLVHFLLIGAVVYAVLAQRPPDAGERRIVVDEAVVGRLVERWQQSFRRLPSQAELDAQIRDYVKGEVYYREALRLGLDRDDEALQRLMRNKLAATFTADAEAARPSDAELQALLDQNPARYANVQRFDFTQVYLGDDNPANRARATGVLAQLNAGGDPTKLTRPAPLPLRYAGSSAEDITAQFGTGFVPAMQAVHGQWEGPVSSGLGLHLVKVERSASASKPKLADVRQRLENDWRAEAIRAAEDKRYRELLKGYDVVTKLD